MKNKCLYVHRKKDTLEPFYIGIGSTLRAYSKKGRSAFWNKIVNKYGYVIEIISENLSAEEAMEKEKYFITLYGRRDQGKGTLCNLTDGGEGCCNRIVSTETRIRIRRNNPKVWLGKKRPELAEMTRRLWTNRKHKPSSIEKMRISHLGERSYMFGRFGKDSPSSKAILCTNTGMVYDSVSTASKELGLNIGHIASVARGVLKQTGKFKYPGGLHFKYL